MIFLCFLANLDEWPENHELNFPGGCITWLHEAIVALCFSMTMRILRCTLARLQRYQQRDGLTCYAYVLMSNHVHLLVETGVVPLSRTMQTLQFTYSQYYNRRYGKSGHLFQGRYKAILCDRDAYLLELVRYLHLNPARLRNPLDPWRYPWSSHGVYLGKPSPVRVETSMVLEQFHRQVGPARQAYRQFLREGLPQGHQAQYYETVDQRFLGDERFLSKIQRKSAPAHEIDPTRRQVPFPHLVRAVVDATGVPKASLVGVGHQRALVEPRGFLVFAVRSWTDLTMKELGQRLRRDPSTMSRLYSKYLTQRRVAWERRLKTLLSQ